MSSLSKSDFGRKLLRDLHLRKVSSPDQVFGPDGRSKSNSNSHQIVVFRNGKDSKPAKKNPMASQRMDYGFSQVHVSQIWRGVQKLNQIIKMKDGSMGVHNLDRDTILVGRELLRGAIDLEESLRLLVNLQEDDSNRRRKTRSNVKLIQIDDDDKEDDDGNSMDRHSDNRGRREKGRMSSVVMKLMGLEDFPQMDRPEENTSSSSSSSQLQVTRSHGRRALKNANPAMAEHKNKKQPFSGGRGTRNGYTSNIDKTLQAVKKPEMAKQSKRDSLASQKNQRTKPPSVGMNQRTDKKKKKKKVVPLQSKTETRIKEETTKAVLKSQVLPNTVEEAIAFLLHTSNDKDELLDDRKLALDSAFEVTKRKYEKYEAALRPYSRTVRSLNDLVREVWRDMEMLRCYGGEERDILTMVEKDVCDQNSDINCMWDRDWNNVGMLPLRYSDSEDIVTKLEKQLISYVIDELIVFSD